MDAAAPQALLLVTDDLIFPSRVREAVREGNRYVVRVAASSAAALSLAQAEPPAAAVLVNLNARRFDPLAVIRAFKSDAGGQVVPLLAFAGHVETDKHAQARNAGADMVAANSSVSLHLPVLLLRLLAGERATDEAVVEIEAA